MIFTVTSTNSKGGLNLVCNVNIANGSLKSESLKIMPRNLNEIVTLYKEFIHENHFIFTILEDDISFFFITSVSKLLLNADKDDSHNFSPVLLLVI
jgi:hypothetical protein